MKTKFMMLTLLIPSLKQSGMDIDVFLQPLVDHLKVLWEDVIKKFDEFKKQYFIMRVVLLWTNGT